MNDKRYQWILYVIVFVILGTISIQVYWNYKNYQVNKQQLINDVQVSLDNAIDTYYVTLAKRNTIGFAIDSFYENDFYSKDGTIDSIFEHLDISNKNFKGFDSIISPIKGVTFFHGIKTDSFLNDFRAKRKTIFPDSLQTYVEILNVEPTDSASQENFKILTSKIVISLTHDTLSLKKIDTLLSEELKRKNLNIDYGLSFQNKDKEQNLKDNFIKPSSLNTVSKSTFLPKNSILTVYFTNETKIILKRILVGILISTLLVLVVISCLFYLLKIIKHQKQLAEVKNDLISNITHEFKTPIATIGVALESIKNFNVIEDKEKTKTYLDISNAQLSKLNIMVEKLLETATLDSDSLKLIKEACNIKEILKSIIDKHQIRANGKTINFTTWDEEIIANVDVFHFENAINNVIDNAIKYGGEIISINLTTHKNTFEIAISDNGNTITKVNKDKVFEKFYRIPKGNTHDVKGFGIGLYYTKKIIEKHQGTIQLDLNNKQTTFKISLPNE